MSLNLNRPCNMFKFYLICSYYIYSYICITWKITVYIIIEILTGYLLVYVICDIVTCIGINIMLYVKPVPSM